MTCIAIRLYQLCGPMYDPSVAGWTKLDRLMCFRGDPESLNWYAFVEGNPVGFVDLYGLSLGNDCVGAGLNAGIGSAIVGGGSAALAGFVGGPAVSASMALGIEAIGFDPGFVGGSLGAVAQDV